jgi:hypothetical protein
VTQPSRPGRGVLRRGGAYGRYVLPSEADDTNLRCLAEIIFPPSPPGQPENPQLVQQLLNYAPQPDRTGAGDWDRPLRADETAEVWDTPMEGPGTRENRLRRADELCRARGKPLSGPGGLLPDDPGPEAYPAADDSTWQLPHTSQGEKMSNPPEARRRLTGLDALAASPEQSLADTARREEDAAIIAALPLRPRPGLYLHRDDTRDDLLVLEEPSDPEDGGAIIDLSFLDTGPVPADDNEDWYEPLTAEQVAVLLDEAARSAGDFVRVARIQMRLGRGMQGGRHCPCPAQQRMNDLGELFVDRYREGSSPGLVAELCRLMHTSAGREPEALPGDRRFTSLDGVPSHDDPELMTLMEAVRRLPRDRADTAIESLLRCALGYERTQNPEFLTRLASNALVTLRARRDPENQKALDAVPSTRD